MREHIDIDARHVFGVDAAGYDAGRLDYPDRIYEILSQRCGLGRTSRVFEIGAGSGIATRRILQRRVRELVAIEPNAQSADVLRKTALNETPRLTIRTCAFEETDLPAAHFDIGLAATSFHWLDPVPSLRKIAEVLRPGGWWAMWWNIYRDPDGLDEFSQAAQPLFDDCGLNGQDPRQSLPYELQSEVWARTFNEIGFQTPEVETIAWSVTHSARRLRALYSTYSVVRGLSPRNRKAFLDAVERIAATQFGDSVERTYMTKICTAQKGLSAGI